MLDPKRIPKQRIQLTAAVADRSGYSSSPSSPVAVVVHTISVPCTWLHQHAPDTRGAGFGDPAGVLRSNRGEIVLG